MIYIMWYVCKYFIKILILKTNYYYYNILVKYNTYYTILHNSLDVTSSEWTLVHKIIIYCLFYN